MPRIPRLDEPGTLHHVMNRGAGKRRVFLGDECRLRFIGLLSALPRRFGVKVHAFALLPNHFHLVLAAGAGGLGDAMQYLQGQYSRWLNAQPGWDGPVWQSRYKSRLIDSEPYLAHLAAYVHLNPWKAGLAGKTDDPSWTSHAFYTGESRCPEWFSPALMLQLHGGAEAFERYVADVKLGVEPGPDGFDPDHLFRARRRSPEPATEDEPPPPGPWPLSEDAAWMALSLVTGRTRAELERRRPGPSGNPAWWLVQWWLPLSTSLSGADVARLRVERSMPNRRAAAKLRARARTDRQLARWMERLISISPLDPELAGVAVPEAEEKGHRVEP
jgi:REP element-mobilizing transposase RayT